MNSYLLISKISRYYLVLVVSSTLLSEGQAAGVHIHKNEGSGGMRGRRSQSMVQTPSLSPPVWPDDFTWIEKGNKPSGYECIQIKDKASAGRSWWKNNYFCWNKLKQDPGMEWSYNIPIQNMRCTNVVEMASGFNNYLCVPHESPLHFTWSQHKPLHVHDPDTYQDIMDRTCIRWKESSSRSWSDKYLCATTNYNVGPESSLYDKSRSLMMYYLQFYFLKDRNMIPEGVVRCYDKLLSSPLITIDTKSGAYLPGERHGLPASVNDKCSSIAFNLPLGTVMTVTEHLPSTTNINGPGDLSKHGHSHDLIGLGRPVIFRGTYSESDNRISSFFWREVDLTPGAVELFEHPGYRGNKQILFLDEFNQDSIHDFSRWSLENKVSSMRWILDGVNTIKFYKDIGFGNTLSIVGWNEEREIVDLSERDFSLEDQFSSFTWNTIPFQYEEIHPFELNAVQKTSEEENGYTFSYRGTNNSTLSQNMSVEFSETSMETLTLTESTTFTKSQEEGFTYGMSVTASASSDFIFGSASVETTRSWEVSMSRSSSSANTDENAEAFTHVKDFSFQQSIQVEPKHNFSVQCSVKSSKFDNVPFETKIDRWYDQKIPGSIEEVKHGKTMWKRTDTVRGYLDGALNVDVYTSIVTTPAISSE